MPARGQGSASVSLNAGLRPLLGVKRPPIDDTMEPASKRVDEEPGISGRVSVLERLGPELTVGSPGQAEPSVLDRLGPELSTDGSSGRGERDAFGCIPGVDPPPSQGKKSFCFNFLRGQCHWPICDFNHYTATELKAIHCPSFTEHGSCKYGPDCVYRH